MEPYEMFKSQVLSGLSEMSAEQLRMVQHALDKAAAGYDVAYKQNAVAVYDQEEQPLVKLWIASKRVEGLSDQTLEGYRIIVGKFFQQVCKAPADVTSIDIRMWMAQCMEVSGISSRTMESYRERVCRFFTWAHDEGLIQTNPAKHVSKTKFEVKPREALTLIEFEKVRRATKNLRDLAIVDVMYSTGCRVSELCGLKISDVNMVTREVHLFGKGKKHRTSFLNARALVSLTDYLNSRDDECGSLFVSLRKPAKALTKEAVEKMFRELRQNSGVEKNLTPHVMRHTTATQMLTNSDIATVSRLLGHESPATTAVYTHLTNRDIQWAHERSVV